MAVQTTVEVPDAVYDLLLRKAEASGTSVPSLIVETVVAAYQTQTVKRRVTGPIVKGKFKMGPACPTDENPYDLILP